MKLTVNGREVILPKNLTIEYSEGNDFFEEGSFSLSIEIPLAVETNREIFGSLMRHEQYFEDVVYYAVLEAGDFRREGSLCVDKMTHQSLFVQFMAGLSEQKLRALLDRTYINEMEFSIPGIYDEPLEDGDPRKIQTDIAISVPWKNNQEPNFIHNQGWFEASHNCQPNLRWLTRQILRNAGFLMVDLGDWDNSEFANLYVLNALPDLTYNRDLKYILPHWTVSEYMEQISLLLNAVWDVDYERMIIKLDLLLARTYGRVFVPASRRIGTLEKKMTGEAVNAPSRGFGVKYKEGNNALSFMDKCEGFEEAVKADADLLRNDPYKDEYGHVWQDAARYHTNRLMPAFIHNSNWQDSDYMMAEVDYIHDNDSSSGNKGRQHRKIWAMVGGHNAPYFCLCSDYEKSGKYLWPVPLNVAGASEATKMKECKIVPCPMDFPNVKHPTAGCVRELPLVHAPVAVFDIAVSTEDTETVTDEEPSTEVEVLVKGLKEKSVTTEYFDRLNVAFYEDYLLNHLRLDLEASVPSVENYPLRWFAGSQVYTDFYLFERLVLRDVVETANFFIRTDFCTTNQSLRRSFIEGENTLVGSRRLDMSAVYTFEILCDSMPSVQAVYDIDGQLYFPKKIRCTIDAEHGVSQRKKFECYKVI